VILQFQLQFSVVFQNRQIIGAQFHELETVCKSRKNIIIIIRRQDSLTK